MHHFHFQYVSAVPSCQNCSSLFQLLDDINPRQRTALLRSAYLKLRVSGADDSSNYREFKRRLNALACLVSDQEIVVYGMICFILGDVLRRITYGIFQIVDKKRELLEVFPDKTESKSMHFLREEEHELRLAYQSFCEMVVSVMLNDYPGVDDGIDLLMEEPAQTPVQQDEAPVKPLLDDFEALKKLSEQLFPSDEKVRPAHPTVVTFLDQLAANFEKTIRNEDDVLVVKVVDKSVQVAVSPFSEPTIFDPSYPLMLRITISRTQYNDNALRALGLPRHPVSSLNCRLEFTVLPNELSLLATWVADWIKCQQSRDPNPPTIPILLAGEQSFFDFTGDPTEETLFVEPVAEVARSAFASGGEGWLNIDYIWSRAARAAYNEWQTKRDASS